jgi:phospholipid/cholesterol/gamma-HCH transport system substrate-binding protein
MSKEFRVGLLIAVTTVIFVIAVFAIGNQEGVWKRRYELRVKYHDIYGLQPGAPARLAGLRVGTVKHIEFSKTEPGNIIIVLQIDQDVKPLIRTDSKALIGTLGLLGDKTIEISVGSSDNPVLEDGAYIQASKSASIEAVIAEGGEAVENITLAAKYTKETIEKINNGTGSLGLFVNDPNVYFDLDRLLKLTENLTRQLEEGRGSFARFITDSSFYVEMRNLLGNTNRLFDSLSTGKGTLSQLLYDPAPYQDFKQIVANWKRITDRINAGEGTAGKLLTDDSLYINFTRALDRTDALLKDFRENPGRYIRIRLF